jgi:putative transposase
VRTAEGGEERGYDAGKKITGRKRHLAVDTLGLVWAVVVHGSYWQDHEGAHLVLMVLRQQCRRLKVVFADSAYGRHGLPDWVRTTFGWLLQTVFAAQAMDCGAHVFVDRSTTDATPETTNGTSKPAKP